MSADSPGLTQEFDGAGRVESFGPSTEVILMGEEIGWESDHHKQKSLGCEEMLQAHTGMSLIRI